MSELELVDKKALRDALYDADAITMYGMAIISQFLTVEAVPKELFEQIRWERNIAIEQLKELGIGLGEKTNGIYLDKEDYDELLEYKWKYKDLNI